MLNVIPLCYDESRYKKGSARMALHYITASAFDAITDMDRKVCVYCDTEVYDYFCPSCNEYKGVMSVADWESYTGETWEY